MAGPVVRSSNLQFFLDRADQARAEAEAATLDHVRERCRRSEAAWSALAEKAQRGVDLRLEDEQRKAADAASNSDEDLTIKVEALPDRSSNHQRLGLRPTRTRLRASDGVRKVVLGGFRAEILLRRGGRVPSLSGPGR